MRARLLTIFRASAVSATILIASSLAAGAADLDLQTPSASASAGCAAIVLTCENGREYPICPIAVSVAGDLVTGSLYTAPHRSVHIRLVPMGVGYRYAGKGIWVDGLRGSASINFSNSRSIACSVQGS